MQDLAPYTYLLIFAALMLLNYVMQRIARWLRQQQAAEAAKSKPSQAKAEQQLEELKRREQLPPQGAEVRRRIEESALGARQAPASGSRARSRQDEPAEVRESRARAKRTRAAAIAPPPERALPGVKPLLRGRRNLRQAIIVATVLGPCRAQQPPDAG
jgi:hypothetical protein